MSLQRRDKSKEIKKIKKIKKIQGFMDMQTCARYGDDATCRWHPCKFHLVSFSW